MITLAFYKGRGKTRWSRFWDWAIRFATRSEFSHMEFIAGPAKLGGTVECLSASVRDGGVRSKPITLEPGKWVLIELEMDPEKPAQIIRSYLGAPYDYTAIIFSHTLALNRHDKTHWFCSEICAEALGIPNSYRYSPQLLYDVVSWYNQAK